MSKQQEIRKILQEYKGIDSNKDLKYLEDCLQHENWQSEIKEKIDEVGSLQKAFETDGSKKGNCDDIFKAAVDIRIALEK